MEEACKEMEMNMTTAFTIFATKVKKENTFCGKQIEKLTETLVAAQQTEAAQILHAGTIPTTTSYQGDWSRSATEVWLV